MARARTRAATRALVRSDTHSDFAGADEPCCCPPRAMVWIDTRTSNIFVENKIDMRRAMLVRADANASLRPPAGPDTNADGSGGSEIDETTMKAQGKVYRTDVYTVHWQAEGECKPLLVHLRVTGAIDYEARCIPTQGEVTLSRAYMLEPPYQPVGPDSVQAELVVRDCARHVVRCENRVPRP